MSREPGSSQLTQWYLCSLLSILRLHQNTQMLLSLTSTYTHCLPTYVRTYSLLPRSILLTARHHHNHQTSNPITTCTLGPKPNTPIHCSLQSPYHLKEEHFPDSTQSYLILISSTSTRAFIKKTTSTTITGNLKRRVAMPETHPLQCTCVPNIGLDASRD